MPQLAYAGWWHSAEKRNKGKKKKKTGNRTHTTPNKREPNSVSQANIKNDHRSQVTGGGRESGVAARVYFVLVELAVPGDLGDGAGAHVIVV